MGNLLTATQLVNSKALTQTHSNLLGPLRILPTGSQEGDQQVIKFPPRVSLSDRSTDTYTIHTNLPHTHGHADTHTHNISDFKVLLVHRCRTLTGLTSDGI